MLITANGGHASHSVARALVQLVERLDVLNAATSWSSSTIAMSSTAIAGSGADTGARGALSDVMESATAGARAALRQLTARSREGALLCRIVDGTLVLEGVPISYRGLSDEPFLDVLRSRLSAVGASSLTVREGASPGELLTLGRVLAPSRGTGGTPALAQPALSDTPTGVRVFATADDAPRELLRTWSILVLPQVPANPPSAANSITSSAADATTPHEQRSALARLASARTDAAVSSAVTMLIGRMDDALRTGDALAIDGIARGCLAQLRVVGAEGGRLALERLVRQLLRPPVLTLLAQRLPHSADRSAILQLMSRAGDVAVETLIAQLMTTDDALARRAYFDGIVAMDVASTQLFDLLRDPRWFVVRNAAALLGEMNVEHTDVALVPLLQHNDERIRIAVARALTRVRTPKALQALHACLDDALPEVRRLAAAAFGLSTGSGGIRPPAARLSAALDREQDEDVALEMLAALGRLGSADAVQRLVRIAVPSTTESASADRTGPRAPLRDPWRRIAALEALAHARGNAMLPVIDTLMNDADRDVAAAALRVRKTVTGTA